MKTVADKHAYIDLEDKEVNELSNVLDFLTILNNTIDKLEEENTSWDIRCSIGEDELFDMIATIRYLAHQTVFNESEE